MKKRYVLLLAALSFFSIAAVYPPDTQLTFKQMPSNIPMPAYLTPFTDPNYKTVVTRIADKEAMQSDKDLISHHYAKDQPWNADGSLIMLSGWPSALLDGKTYRFLRWIWPQGEHHTWSNVDPRIVYGIQPPNTWVKLDVITGESVDVRTFDEYSTVSFGSYEGNISNDDHYVALMCKTATGNRVAVYDLPNDRIVSAMDIGDSWPDNVSMSQSGKYVAVEWGVNGSGERQGLDIYLRDLTYVRKIGFCGGCHFDLGYDTDGNEVAVMGDNDGGTRGVVAVRLDTGKRTMLLTDAQMSWYIHVSCRNVNRPGWAYLTEYADPNTQTRKANYQLAFGVKIDGSGTVECFANVHHSPVVVYEREPFGVPNRDASKMMFRSDWENGTGPIYSYVAEMPSETNTSVNEHTEQAPSGYRLSPLFPNPFNAVVTIRYAIPRAERVEVAIRDVTGRRVYLLENRDIPAGEHTLTWNAIDDKGKAAGSGLYFATLRAGTVLRVERVMLMR